MDGENYAEKESKWKRVCSSHLTTHASVTCDSTLDTLTLLLGQLPRCHSNYFLTVGPTWISNVRFPGPAISFPFFSPFLSKQSTLSSCYPRISSVYGGRVIAPLAGCHTGMLAGVWAAPPPSRLVTSQWNYQVFSHTDKW